MAADASSSPSLAQQAIEDLTVTHERFKRSTHNLTGEVSRFTPAARAMSAAQHVAHAARVIDWFIEGAFRPEGFDMNFEEQIKLVMAVESLAEARAWFDRAMANAVAAIATQTDADLMTPLPPGPVLGGVPRLGIVREIVDHTAHHRGALTVYARMKQIVPPDPYGM